jgi:flagellar hook assembly protein FlgD
VEGPVRAEVFDIGGRAVRSLHDGVLATGRHKLFWNGRNESGVLVPTGVYLVRVSGSQSTRVTVVR